MLQKPAIILLFSLFLFACAANEILLPKSGQTSVDLDISGHWQLQKSSRETIDRLQQAEGQNVIRLGTKPSKRSKAKKSGTLVFVFLENGVTLKVTQTDFGLFISFDRSIVEEYRFGEHRTVSVGPIEADRVSGWEAGAYVIETLADDGSKLVERYLLEDAGSLLVRQISVFEKGVLAQSLVQRFDRIPAGQR